MLGRAAAFGAILLLAPPARGQDASDRDIAKGHFEAGRGYYAKGEYDRALREFQAAYELTGLADLQYNVAQCQERLFQIDEALAAYRLYLANGKPSDRDRAFVEKRIALLEKQVAGRPAPAAPAPAAPVPSPPSAVPARDATAPAPQSAPPDGTVAPAAPPAAAGGPAIDLTTAPPSGDKPDAWYRSWWIWGAAGGAAIGIVATALVLSAGGAEPEPIYQGGRASLPLP